MNVVFEYEQQISCLNCKYNMVYLCNWEEKSQLYILSSGLAKREILTGRRTKGKTYEIVLILNL